MPFFRTTVTIKRPYSGLTPLGVTEVIVKAETEAPDAWAARKTAIEHAQALVIADLDNVKGIDADAE